MLAVGPEILSYQFNHCMSGEYDTIIIGAGMSGLAAGIRLAHFDQRVCILERHYTIGGLNSFYRMGGRDYDVGLHAMTNFARKGTKKGPLAKLIRQLRFRWDDFKLAEQVGSSIRFPDVSLDFTNDIKFLEAEIADRFPSQIDGFSSVVRIAARLQRHGWGRSQFHAVSSRGHGRTPQ